MQEDLSYIVEPLRHLAVPITDLSPDPENARKHNEANLAAIRASLTENGQYLPIVVQREGMIVRVGNGRLTQAKALGWTHMAAVVVPMDRVAAIKLALADNRTGDLATWDEDMLKLLVNELEPTDLTPFWTADELSAYTDTFAVTPLADLPSLATAEQRTPLQQMTFTLSDDQVVLVKQVVSLMLAAEKSTDPLGVNPNKNGNALAAACALVLELHGAGD